MNLPEIARIRIGAQAAAWAIVALLVLLALQRFPNRFTAPNAGSRASIVVSVIAPPSPPRILPSVHHVERLAEAPLAASPDAPPETADAAPGESFHMFLDTTAGRVEFTTPAEYRRCLDAALAHVSATGCPPPPPRLATDRPGTGPHWRLPPLPPSQGAKH